MRKRLRGNDRDDQKGFFGGVREGAQIFLRSGNALHPKTPKAGVTIEKQEESGTRWIG